MLLQGMAGFDAKDSTSIDEPVPDFSANLNGSLQGLRIGVPKEYFSAGLDPRIAELVTTASKSWKSSAPWSRKSACRTCSTRSLRTT
jgi:aspartyl-tRNA(Asn)/glutamyl-tRNA(Gln) amidotransferase subunit A